MNEVDWLLQRPIKYGFSFLVTDDRYPPATNSPTDVTRKSKTGEQVD